MFEWFATAVASANAAKEISQSLIALRDEEIIRSRVFDLTNSLMELQQQLMQAQLEQMDLVKKVQTLEAEKSQLENQRALRDGYTLHKFPDTGAFAYRVNQADVALEGELDHYICCSCFDAGHRIILQPRAYGLACPKCSGFIQTKWAEAE